MSKVSFFLQNEQYIGLINIIKKMQQKRKRLNCKPKIYFGHGDDETQTIS
jgi:hypothetical protein